MPRRAAPGGFGRGWWFQRRAVGKMVPMELRTARRRKGLLEVSPTIRACTAEGGAVADERPEILRVGERVHRGEQARPGRCAQHVVKRRHCRNLAHGQHALEHGEADELFEHAFSATKTGISAPAGPRGGVATPPATFPGADTRRL